MERKIISSKIVKTIDEYGIIQTKEKLLDTCGKPFGKMQVWYDICLDYGIGDIVASFPTLRDAKKWIKEN